MLSNAVLYMGCRLYEQLWCMLFHASSPFGCEHDILVLLVIWKFRIVSQTYLKLNQVAVACFDVLLVFQVYSLYELIIYLHLV